MISTNLFDKIIDVEFTIEEQEEAGGVTYENNVGSVTVKNIPSMEATSQKISFRTPREGVKPNISLLVDFLPGEMSGSVTLKITNFFSPINISLYKKMRIRAGYSNGPTQIFDCEIFEVYTERPNPEGITVFMANIGVLTELLNSTEEVKFTLKKETVKSMLSKVASAMKLQPNIALTPAWLKQTLPIDGHDYTFTNALTARTWLVDLLNSIANNVGLPKLFISVGSGLLKVYNVGTKTIETPVIVLDKVSVAYLAGGYINIKAPWNPMIPVNESAVCFQMDTRFFRGRRGALHVGGEKKEFSIYSMHLSFGTQGENEMSLQAVDTSTGAPS